MRRDERTRWIWPLLAVLTTLGSMGAVDARLARRSAAVVAEQNAGGRLLSALERQRDFYQSNHGYTVRPAELGLKGAAGDPWSYRVIASRIDNQPILLMEAESGSERLCIDAQGRLYQSPMATLPGVAAWLPPVEGARSSSGR